MRHTVLVSIWLSGVIWLGLSASVCAQSAAGIGQEGDAATESPQNVDVVAGPLQGKRVDLYNRIQSAKLMGVGISTYMMVFDDIESMVKSGKDAEQIQKRIDSVSQSLSDQLSRMEVLQTEQSSGPIVIEGGRTGGGSGSPADGDMSGGAPGLPPVPGGGGMADLPPGLQDKLPQMLQNPQFREKLRDPTFMRNAMKNPAIMQKLEQLKGKYGGMMPAGMDPDQLQKQIERQGVDPGMLKQMEGVSPGIMQKLSR